jgi:DNA-binding response OmpR family regulator
MNILLAEDSNVMAVISSQILRDEGHTVEIVATVDELRKRMKVLPTPDVLLLDWFLADGNVGEVLMEMCLIWSAARVVVVTGATLFQLPAMLPVPIGVLVKPYTPDVLRRVVSGTPAE